MAQFSEEIHITELEQHKTSSAVLIILQCAAAGKSYFGAFGGHQNLVCVLLEPQQVARASVNKLGYNVEMSRYSTQ